MILDKLELGVRRKVPVMMSGELNECGHVCLAMVAGYHGQHWSMTELRAKHPPPAQGSSLDELMRIADAMGLASRALRLEMEHLPQLKLPAVLHWNFSHFVVLVKVSASQVTLHDPALGEQTLSLAEVSRHFTGVALELEPDERFVARKRGARLTLGGLIGRVRGLAASASVVLGAALMLELVGLLLPMMGSWVADDVLVNHDADLLNVLGVGFLALIVLKAVLGFARSWSLTVLSTGIRVQVAERFLRHTLRLPSQFFERRRAADLVQRFESLEDIERTLASTFAQTLLDGLFALLIVCVLFAYSTKLGALVLGTTLIYAVLRAMLYRPAHAAQMRYVQARARQDASLLETLAAMLPIQLAGKGAWRLAQWGVHQADSANAQLALARLGAWGSVANTLLFGGSGIVFLWLAGHDALSGALSVGALFAVIAYQQMASQRLTALVDAAFEFKLLSVHLERLADIAFEKPVAEEPVRLSDSDMGPLDFELRQVHFRYNPNEPEVLSGVSLRIEAGEHVCITGPSGCGKSTLLKILTGVLEPTAGEVLVNGEPLAKFGVQRLRAMSAVVLQDDRLFFGSVADNIAYFDARTSMQDVVQAAWLAGVHEDIAQLPMQYQTLCAEGGATLSGGQKQRVLLARALYRRPRALLLDEATSHLDVAAESRVSENVGQLRTTRISIAHRPETMRRAERVVLLHAGRVAADGSAQQVLDLLAQLQASEEPAEAPLDTHSRQASGEVSAQTERDGMPGAPATPVTLDETRPADDLPSRVSGGGLLTSSSP